MVLSYFMRDIRKALGCICCLILLGPFLLGIGIWQYFEAPFNTEQQASIRNMNKNIQLWNDQYYTDYQNQFFYMGDNRATQFMADQSTDLVNVQGLNSYTPLRYYHFGDLPLNSTTLWRNDSYPFTLSLNLGHLEVNGTAFYSKNTTDTIDICNVNQGKWLNTSTPMCTYFYVLNHVCVKVHMLPDHEWELDNTYGGQGCWYGLTPGLVGSWIPFNYTKVPYAQGALYNTTFNFTNIRTSIRSIHDPYILAQYLTLGTLQFGLTPQQKQLLGIILICVGAFFQFANVFALIGHVLLLCTS